MSENPNSVGMSIDAWVSGARLYFRSDKWPGEIHIHAATLEDQAGYAPDAHVVVAESPAWLRLSDDVPEYGGFHAEPRVEE